MWWEIRELWLGASIRTKIKIYALAVILVMGLSAGISVQITGFGLDSFNQILYDNSKCNNFHEALTEETDCFTRYARERSQDNREAYEKACEKTARCLNQLPFDYASIGSERYAGTWTIKSSYMNYQKARDAFLRMDQDTSGYIPALYKVYERQQYMDTYIRRLIQVTLSDGNANYQNEVEKLYNLPRYLVVFSVVLMIFIGMFTRVLSNTLVEPMVKLAGLSREMEKNHFDMPDLAVENRDEMGELVTAFNRMKHSMGDYISTLKRNHEMTELLHKEELERVEMEKQLEAARLEFLKSQINPHFLFNTLNMISCTAKLEKAGTTEKMIASLSSLFRYNLKMSEQVVFLEQELKIVDDYIYIQKMRFGGRIRYERDLPEDIRVIDAKEVPERFHSRLSAVRKTYAYYVETADRKCVFERKYVYGLGRELDIPAMEKAAGYLLGEHDFKSFCSNKRMKKSTVRRMDQIGIHTDGTKVVFTYTGNGFLYNMVRILTGTLLEVGLGKRRPEEMTAVLEARNREAAGATAPPEGLLLMQVEYDGEA